MRRREDVNRSEEWEEEEEENVQDEKAQNESENDETEEEHTSGSKPFQLAFHRQFDPLRVDPFDVLSQSAYAQASRGPARLPFPATQSLRFGERKRLGDGTYDHVLFQPVEPTTHTHRAASLFFRALDFLNHERGNVSSKQGTLLATENIARFLETQRGDESSLIARLWHQSLTTFAQRVLSAVENGDDLCLSHEEMEAALSISQQQQSEGGTYLIFLTDGTGLVSGVYVGRSRNFLFRLYMHLNSLARQMCHTTNPRQIAQLLYQSMALTKAAEGRILFYPCNVFTVEDQAANEHMCLFEAVWCAILGTFRMNRQWLQNRALYGLPACHFDGLNSSPCFDAVEAVAMDARKATLHHRLNPTLKLITDRLHAHCLRFAIRRASRFCDGAPSDAGKTDFLQEYEDLYERYIAETGRLLQAGTFIAHFSRDATTRSTKQGYRWCLRNLGNRALPSWFTLRLLESVGVSNDHSEPVTVTARICAQERDVQSDVFIGLCERLRPMLGGFRILLGDAELPLQFTSLVHRSERTLAYAQRLVRFLPEVHKKDRLALPAGRTRERRKAEGDALDLDYYAHELIADELPLSKCQDVHAIALGVRLQKTSFSVRQSKDEDLFEEGHAISFLRLQSRSAIPLAVGSGLPKEDMILLGNVGLQMLTPSREEWLDLPVTIRGGQRTHFVRLMCRAVQLRHERDVDAGEVRSSQTCSDPASAAVTPSTSAPGPDFEDPLSSMGGFQVFSRSLPRMKTISSVVAIDAIGQRARNTGRGRFNVPVTLLRTWFPDLQYGKGHRISAKIDGRFAKCREEVKVWVRLDTDGGGLYQGVWFDLAAFKRDALCPASIWRYVQHEQARLDELVGGDFPEDDEVTRAD